MTCIRIYSNKPGYYLKVLADRSLVYVYDFGGDGDYFEFSTYQEVGEMYQAEFDNLVSVFGLRILRGLIRASPPWVVDIVTNEDLPDCPENAKPGVLSVGATIGGQVVNVTIRDVEMIRETQ